MTRPVRDQRGFSLVETMVALCLLLVVTAEVLPLAVLTFRISENHGHLLARATEYAQDKLEQPPVLSPTRRRHRHASVPGARRRGDRPFAWGQ